jgi:hypothetical protein
MGLSINQDKNKYMFLLKRTKIEEDMKDLEVDDLTFQKVSSFNYLGVNVNNINFIHEEIKLCQNSTNKVYFAIISMFKSKLHSRKIKENFFTINLKLIDIYGCNTWTTTREDYNKLLIIERKILRKIYSSNFDDNK